MNISGRWITTVESPHHTKIMLWILAALIQPLAFFSEIFTLPGAMCRLKTLLAIQIGCEAIPTEAARPAVDTEHQAVVSQCKCFEEFKLIEYIHLHMESIFFFFIFCFCPVSEISVSILP